MLYFWQLTVLAVLLLGSDVHGTRLWEVHFQNATQSDFPKVVVKDHNVYRVDSAGGETALTTYATANTSFDDINIYKSQDSRYAIVYQIATPGQNRTINLVESSPTDQLQPKLHVVQYDKAGDVLPIIRPRLFDLVDRKEIEIGQDFIDNPFQIEDAAWQFRDHTYRFIYYERGFKLLQMIEINADGKARILVEETRRTSVDINKIAWGYLNQTARMWWLSERDGFNHVYLVDTAINGTRSMHQVTTGNYSVWDVIHVDEHEETMYFEAYGLVPDQDPYHVHLARINFDGTGFLVLTAAADGSHNSVWTVNDTVEDRWIRPLDDVDSHIFDNITLPERFHTPGRDGKTLIYGIIIRPKAFDPNKRYRVVEYTYPAPQEFAVPKDLSPSSQKSLAHYQKLADTHGVIVVLADGFGTSWRGKEFQNYSYKNLSDWGFPDRIAWIRAAASTRPWMDLAGGVGIYGSSAGGAAAMAALLWHSDFYSGCGGNEQWLGWPIDESYTAGSNIVHADRLNGTLLLLAGELDENVDPSSTMQVVSALNRAGKENFDYLIVPGEGHGVINKPIPMLQKKVDDFWRKWLDDTSR
ncbi:Putative peptidase S9, prolyl oligopeptidase, catalytic domain, dipeptidylpeptidase IV [Septoria linicola]|uniref:dipeptidyl-peptidase IV n=1 Tax=Septoria linicola TaxID=215465 RepID=A0A9Q9AW02_9PEZI|nr:Putative peptidase S9, prolyl oligopeptidase, catalytic domain, dipeptidylpeptidase IV [Septoria linicola]